MKSAAPWALATILGLSALLILVGSERDIERVVGVSLKQVSLKLYPSGDPDASWTFTASDASDNPLDNTTRLTGLSNGYRMIRQRDKTGRLTGKEVVDATVRAEELLIDEHDTLLSERVELTLVRECADLVLTGSKAQPVKIEQRGFSAPQARLVAPNMRATIAGLRMRFDFYIEESDPARSKTEFDLDAPEQCVNGKRVKRQE